MHAILGYRGNSPTSTQTRKPTHKHTQTHRQDRLQYTATQLTLARSAITMQGVMGRQAELLLLLRASVGNVTVYTFPLIPGLLRYARNVHNVTLLAGS